MMPAVSPSLLNKDTFPSLPPMVTHIYPYILPTIFQKKVFQFDDTCAITHCAGSGTKKRRVTLRVSERRQSHGGHGERPVS